MAIDAWIQHPTQRFLEQEMFASLFRWTGDQPPAEQPPLSVTLAAMDAGGIREATC